MDADTGAVLHPEHVPAYLTHPANHGRVVTLTPMLTFTAPARPDFPPGLGRPALAPSQSPNAGDSGTTPDGRSLAAPFGPDSRNNN